jgi:hypothetical protein
MLVHYTTSMDRQLITEADTFYMAVEGSIKDRMKVRPVL